ncbi:UNVERIFIED_CONTAM: hypothetical protein PYX00_010668 [Menopon gallinae]|uniref:Uncharacterized protein n=1 Tax=Menopon gallinae TaxID=328185 RepID=A0AAW2HG62_9NEOP
MSTINAMSKRERRRRQNEKCESEDNEDVVGHKNIVHKGGSDGVKDSRTLVRNDTFTVPKPRTVFDHFVSDKGNITNGSNNGENGLGIDLPQSDSDESKNLTHTINVETWSSESKNPTYKVSGGDQSKHDTYNVQKVEGGGEMVRPVPAPRRRRTIPAKEPDKNSSDTDKDVMEIEADDSNRSNKTESLEEEAGTVKKISTLESDSSIEVPKPKPRNLYSMSVVQPPPRKTDSLSKSKSLEEVNVKASRPRSTKSNPETKTLDCGEVKEPKAEVAHHGKEKKGRFAALLRRRKQKKASKMFSSVMKLERARIPTISSILKDLKDDSSKAKLEEEEEDKFDLQIESPRLPQSAPNDKMYVQYKNGFYVKNRDDVFKKDEEELLEGGTGNKRMEDSISSTMLGTAMLFQKYWSRAMMYFHGLVAGFGFAHAFAITTVLLYLNHDFRGFVDIYACLALKIHFMFYMLIALCIISCLDRLDVCDFSKKHWRSLCGTCVGPWIVLIIYVLSFVLTFLTHVTETRFDSHQFMNITGENSWNSEGYSAETFTCWYRIVWARDILVLAAWLLISITEFSDNLYGYLKSLATKVESLSNGEARISAVI